MSKRARLIQAIILVDEDLDEGDNPMPPDLLDIIKHELSSGDVDVQAVRDVSMHYEHITGPWNADVDTETARRIDKHQSPVRRSAAIVSGSIISPDTDESARYVVDPDDGEISIREGARIIGDDVEPPL